MSKGIETRYITVRGLARRQTWEITHHYYHPYSLSPPRATYYTRYSAFKLPEEMQRRVDALDMVALGSAVRGLGARWRLYSFSNCSYELEPWCPFEDLLATGLLTHIKDKSNA